MKLTKELVVKLSATLEEGHYIETACASLGVVKSTFYYWRSEAEKIQSDVEANGFSKIRQEAKRQKLLLYFLDSIEKAQAKAEQVLYKVIRAQSFESWQAAAWILERKFPARWGRKESIDIPNGIHITLGKEFEGV